MPNEAIRITDLATPQLPDGIRQLNQVSEEDARTQIPFAEAVFPREATGWFDLGEERFRAPLRLLLPALDEEALIGCRFEDVGPEPAVLRQRVRPYREFFGVADE